MYLTPLHFLSSPPTSPSHSYHFVICIYEFIWFVCLFCLCYIPHLSEIRQVIFFIHTMEDYSAFKKDKISQTEPLFYTRRNGRNGSPLSTDITLSILPLPLEGSLQGKEEGRQGIWFIPLLCTSSLTYFNTDRKREHQETAKVKHSMTCSS